MDSHKGTHECPDHSTDHTDRGSPTLPPRQPPLVVPMPIASLLLLAWHFLWESKSLLAQPRHTCPLPGVQLGLVYLATLHWVPLFPSYHPPGDKPSRRASQRRRGLFILQPSMTENPSPTWSLVRPLFFSPTVKTPLPGRSHLSPEGTGLVPCHSWLQTCTWCPR